MNQGGEERCAIGFGDMCEEPVEARLSREAKNGTKVIRYFCRGHGDGAISQSVSDMWTGGIKGFTVTWVGGGLRV